MVSSVTLVTCYTTRITSSSLHHSTFGGCTPCATQCNRYDTALEITHLAACHVGHGPVGLDGLQLVQAPVQLLQCLPRPPDIILVCKHKIIPPDHIALQSDLRAPSEPGERTEGGDQTRLMHVCTNKRNEWMCKVDSPASVVTCLIGAGW